VYLVLLYIVTLIIISLLLTLYSFQGADVSFQKYKFLFLTYGGLRWNRTIDLTLIRRAL
jgi:hypothetical protein